MTMGLYYLASPYQGTEDQKAYRQALSLKVAAEFLSQGIHVFSPLIYVNQIAEFMNFSSIETRREIIMAHLLKFVGVSKGLILITAEGWQESWGVRQELLFCQHHQIPVSTMSPEQISGDLRLVLPPSFDQNQVNQLLKAA